MTIRRNEVDKSGSFRRIVLPAKGHVNGATSLGRDSAGHAEALALPGAALFDPSGMNRPFRDWVVVPLASADHWPSLADAALAFTEG